MLDARQDADLKERIANGFVVESMDDMTPGYPLVGAMFALLLVAAPAAGQVLDDGALATEGGLGVTVEYAHDSWERYWEGTLERGNDNIGILTTRSVTWMVAYGFTERITVVAALPYVWTSASQGVLESMHGWQDLTVAAKVRLLETPFTDRAVLRLLAVAGAGMPTTDYTPDFQPLSIGLASRRALARGGFHLRDRSGWFAEGSAGYTWRSNVELDRPAYYTDGRLVFSREVAMPDVSDYVVTVGWQSERLAFPVSLSHQRTRGGGDIRRHDMPFVSNRMDFTKVRAQARVALPQLTAVMAQLGAVYTLSGRNVGRSTTFTAGVTYALAF